MDITLLYYKLNSLILLNFQGYFGKRLPSMLNSITTARFCYIIILNVLCRPILRCEQFSYLYKNNSTNDNVLATFRNVLGAVRSNGETIASKSSIL